MRFNRKYTVDMAAKPKKRMGRPPKPARLKMSKFIGVKVTPDEYRRLRIEARRAGLSIPALLMRPWRKEG